MNKHSGYLIADNGVANWVRFALSPGYYPETLEDAHRLIYLLRERLASSAAPPAIPDPAMGLTRQQAALYRVLRERPWATVPYKDIYRALYGDRCVGQDGGQGSIRVFVHQLRQKLPPNETIEGIGRVGYRWVSVRGPAP